MFCGFLIQILYYVDLLRGSRFHMHHFAIGQRWINNAELQMGLGTVMSVEQRTITILFQATGETRTYSKQTAPLTRVVFAAGDVVMDHQGMNLNVDSVMESNGLLTYIGHDSTSKSRQLPESHLDHQIRLNRPLDRLLTGQIDDNRWFDLRCQTQLQLNRISQSSVASLIGGRTDLIPHQLYIAHEVSRRHAPRVLLADEVGLGKTIEAGLILHEQLEAERLHRVLIVVPETLLHQWLVEMLRRFNLRFSLFDTERYQAMIEFDQAENPFEQEQLVLCSLDLFTRDDACLKRAIEAGWDMLVVDEAHHLQWSSEQASHEYQVIEQIAKATSGVMLLTATPEQLGKAGHYARLRLLDPDRFPDFEKFLKEEQSYETVAEAIRVLFSPEPLDAKAIRQIQKLAGNDPSVEQLLKNSDMQSRTTVINSLLDRHGTGRVLFRNTRAAVKGFPERHAHAYPLSLPEEYALLDTTGIENSQKILSPELLYQSTTTAGSTHWTQFDPRISWLKDRLLSLKPEKVLVICSASQTALDIADRLRLKSGISAAVFHSGLSILERDRVAAYFAEHEVGAQVLVCSEIGSEGRNFQFAHHLVLFDLPLNPDLLEQRIGRLDRIGQTHAVQIHIPYLEQSAQTVLYNWYQQGLDAFTRPCHAGAAVFNQLRSELVDALRHPHRANSPLLQQSRELYQKLNEALEKGRDRLLEYNSCRPDMANSLHQQALTADQESTLANYMEQVFDCFGVHSEEHGDTSLILTPAENMLTSFPHLPDDGLTITYNRQTALAHEDRHFLTWAHPMVTSIMELILGNEHGNTSVVAIKHPAFKPGSLLLECNYLLDSATARSPAIRRYLPTALIRLLLDEKGNNLAERLENAAMNQTIIPVDKDTARKIIALKQANIRELALHSQQLAVKQSAVQLDKVRNSTGAMLGNEISRLRELARVNPNVRPAEIEFFESELKAVNQMFDSVLPRLDAMRIVIAT